jgi:hypothetical protein
MSHLAGIDTNRADTSASRLDSLISLGPEGRMSAYRRSELPIRDLWLWARRFPEEVPLVNGEFEWIV